MLDFVAKNHELHLLLVIILLATAWIIDAGGSQFLLLLNIPLVITAFVKAIRVGQEERLLPQNKL